VRRGRRLIFFATRRRVAPVQDSIRQLVAELRRFKIRSGKLVAELRCLDD